MHDRNAVTEMVLSRNGVIDGKGKMLPRVFYKGAKSSGAIPPSFKLFGVKPIGNIWLPEGEFTSEEDRRIHDAFPELPAKLNASSYLSVYH